MNNNLINNNYLDNYLNRAEYSVVLTKFLDETELSSLLNANHHKYPLTIFGGFDNAERVRVIIGEDDNNINNSDFEIAVLKLEYPKKFVKINHRNVLGTIMSLGIMRNTIGDIIITEDDGVIYVLVIKEMLEYLKQNLTSINNYPVKIKEVALEELKNIKLKEAITKNYIISSMRLDVILSNIIGVSRNEINNYFDEKKVLINHQICINRHYEYKIGDLISVRKFGRIIIEDNIKTTKKNNLVISAKIWR